MWSFVKNLNKYRRRAIKINVSLAEKYGGNPQSQSEAHKHRNKTTTWNTFLRKLALALPLCTMSLWQDYSTFRISTWLFVVWKSSHSSGTVGACSTSFEIIKWETFLQSQINCMSRYWKGKKEQNNIDSLRTKCHGRKVQHHKSPPSCHYVFFVSELISSF